MVGDKASVKQNIERDTKCIGKCDEMQTRSITNYLYLPKYVNFYSN